MFHSVFYSNGSMRPVDWLNLFSGTFDVFFFIFILVNCHTLLGSKYRKMTRFDIFS